MKAIFIFYALIVIFHSVSRAQPSNYTAANAHSHNDYQNAEPFTAAYAAGFGSIEADIFLSNDSLVLGHTLADLQYHRTLENIYLKPLQQQVRLNHGNPYQDTAKELQLLIDIKTAAVPTIDKLTQVLKVYTDLISSKRIKFVITGNRPASSQFISYPAFIRFDGELGSTYSPEALTKIEMISGDFKDFSSWNGKGIFTSENLRVLDSIVSYVHHTQKKIRFWDAPDFVNAWYQFMKLEVDLINTDQIKELSGFLLALPSGSFTQSHPYLLYKPTYKTDGKRGKIKNVIMLIGDGTALPQLYAGYTANHAALNIFQMKNIGISKTSSYDNYITDSAPGATSISSGVKTNNHFVGVDHTGAPLMLLPFYLQKKKIKTGLVTCGDITDATPADFYAHQKDRENSRAIIRDLKNSFVTSLMGSGNESLENVKLFNDATRRPFNDTIIRELEPDYTIVNCVDSVRPSLNKKWIVVEKRAGLSMINGRGDWLMKAFTKSIDVLSKNKEGFFLMTEGAQIDYGGHDNNISYVSTEVADFDQVVGKALKFADDDGETLIIVTADHETGGLTLLDGDYVKGYVSGKFSTSDHTALPVMVFAYGPGSDDFRGVYENTELFNKIKRTFKLDVK